MWKKSEMKYKPKSMGEELEAIALRVRRLNAATGNQKYVCRVKRESIE